jgi:O-antigen chain-terminating methyltransferase
VHDDELTAAIREVRARARARAPNGNLGLEGVAAPDLMPLVHARDAAESKVAAIGTVNPRPRGLKNSIVQSVKRLIARALDWHVREQVEFNRATMACVQATLEAVTDAGRGLAALAAHHRQLREEVSQVFSTLEGYHREIARFGEEFADLRRHWAEWRPAFEDKRSASEIHILRTISELQGAFQHRVTLLEQSYRELTAQQHVNFTAALERNTIEIQDRLWKDLEHIRGEYEKLIYTELRILRNKQHVGFETSAIGPRLPSPPIAIDWMRFAEVFRGSEDRIRRHQRKHVEKFAGTIHEIIDIGCGRGEFLEVAREAGMIARGIDLNAECVALCRSKGLSAERADAFEYLAGLPDHSLGGVFCSQVVEHLTPERVPELIQLIGRKLHPGGLLIVETPNPECLAIFATHFYIDPSHTRPVPAPLLRFYLEESGFGNIYIDKLEPAIESMTAVGFLPDPVRQSFFDGLDYAIVGRKL